MEEQSIQPEQPKHLYQNPSANIFAPEYANGRCGMGKKKIINRIILVRHGETEGNKLLMEGSSLRTHTLDTKLSELGENQAKEIGDFFAKISYQPNKIVVSKLQRTFNTALPTIAYMSKLNHNYELNLTDEWIEYNGNRDEIVKGLESQTDWIYHKETRSEFTARISKAFEKIKVSGTIENPNQVLIFTHSQVISAILSKCICKSFEQSTKCDNMVHFHLSNGSITCIDITEDNSIHIQCVNYTKHLSVPSGHHTPFV